MTFEFVPSIKPYGGVIQGLTRNTKYDIYIVAFYKGIAGPRSTTITVVTLYEGKIHTMTKLIVLSLLV